MTVAVETSGRVRIVRIQRPGVRNAVDRPTADALRIAMLDLAADDSVDVAVLTGDGGTFCAGADLHALASGDPERVNRLEPTDRAPMGPTRLEIDKPVIAAIEGHAVAGGLELALWCDLRVMAEDAVLGVFCRRWGVPLIDGGTVRLPRLIGMSRALDLILTGRAVHAQEALDLGLANRVVPTGSALDEAVLLAEVIASFPQTTMRSDRRSARGSWDLPLREALVAEHHLGVGSIESGGMGDGVARFTSGAGRHGSYDD